MDEHSANTPMRGHELPSSRQQMPFPFILQQNLGPLPEPDHHPPLTTTAHHPTTAPTWSQWQHHIYQTTINNTSTYPADQIRRQTIGDLRIPMILLPPPLPTCIYPRPTSSPVPSTFAIPSEYTQRIMSSHRSIPKSDTPSPSPSASVVSYRCSHCPATFLSNGALKRHTKTAHVERNFHCVCGAAYTERSILRVRSNPTPKPKHTSFFSK